MANCASKEKIIFIPHGIIPFGIIHTKWKKKMNPFRYGCVVAGENYCRRPELQRQFAEPNHCKLFSGEFMETYGIRNVGSISKALKRLVADEIIYEFGGEYLFENPFFREWVRRR